MKPIQGTCLCGTVRYELTGPVNAMVHCHCSMCRKHHGGSFATFASAPLMGFRWLSGTGHVGRYQSSEKGQRFFCKTCGSVAPVVLEDMDMVICPAGNLDDVPEMRPQAHWFVSSKAPWYTISDHLPQHEEYPEEFGTTGVTRPQIDVPAGVVAGSCLCSSVAFEMTGPPIRMMNCHCSRCRRGRSSAHATNLFYRIDDFRFLRGESNVVLYKVPGAKRFAVAFCNRCGGAAPRLYPEGSGVVVPAGTLDNDPGARPEAHIFVNYKANWFTITDSLHQHGENVPL